MPTEEFDVPETLGGLPILVDTALSDPELAERRMQIIQENSETTRKLLMFESRLSGFRGSHDSEKPVEDGYRGMALDYVSLLTNGQPLSNREFRTRMGNPTVADQVTNLLGNFFKKGKM